MRYLNENFENIINEPVPINYGDAILLSIESKFNSMTGQDILEYENGCLFQGYTYEHVPFYKGIMTCLEYTYHGEYRDGVGHGPGKLTLKNGDVYDGEFFHGVFHGKAYIKEDLVLSKDILLLQKKMFSCKRNIFRKKFSKKIFYLKEKFQKVFD